RESARYPKPSLSIVPGRKFSSSTSLFFASLPRISRPSGALRFKVMLFLLRFTDMKYVDSPPTNGGQLRVSSPLPGSSTLITSAPMSPSIMAQKGPAPPTRSTSAMCSGERKPAGGESNVVNETTSPPPITEVGVISTGWRGHQRIGGAATRRHSGHRDAGRCSINCSGVLEAGLDRGWPEIDAAWLRTPALPVWLRTPDPPL